MFAGWRERRRRVGRTGAGLATLVLGLLLTSPAAFASQPTRAEYVELVEPICQRETRAHEDVLDGVDEMVRRGELARAAPRLTSAAAALKAAVARIAAVPRPAADAARLRRWLGFSRNGELLLRRIAADLQAGKRARAEGLVNDLLREAKRANATVAGFDFEYCRVSPARFV